LVRPNQASGLVEAVLHDDGVVGEDPPGHLGIAGLDHLPEAIEGQVEPAQAPDHDGVVQLVRVVGPVAAPGVDLGRYQEAGLVVEAQGPRRELAGPGEGPDQQVTVAHVDELGPSTHWKVNRVRTDP
jgi:hypothetical protein